MIGDMSNGTSAVGRPSKGNRKALMSRAPIPVADKIEELAAAAGYKYVGDFVVSILAREAGMPEYAPAQQLDCTSVELPIPKEGTDKAVA